MSDSRPIPTPELPSDVRGGCSSPSHCSALRGDWNTHMPCGHLRQFGTLGDVFPVHCLACENECLRAKLKATKRYLRAANKGAERNSLVAQLSAMRNVKLDADMDALLTELRLAFRDLRDEPKCVRWHCENCNRRGTVNVEPDEQLHRICSDIFDAHNTNWHCMCPDWAMHVSL